jgi:pyruvate dehydrogenase (quinone)
MNDLTHVLRTAGITHVYGAVGDSSGIVQAVSATCDLTWIELPTEEAAAFAASEEAHATGQLAVCAGSYEAGKTDLIQGLWDAHQLGAPVLAIASHVGVDDAVHHIHPERMFAECSSYCGVVDDTSELSRLVRTAIQHAVVRGDVAVLLLDSFVAAGPHPTGERHQSRRSCTDAIGDRQSHVQRHAFRAGLCASRRHRPRGL